jgi:hypothetical protein
MRGQKFIDRDLEARFVPDFIAVERFGLILLLGSLGVAAIHHADHRRRTRAVRLQRATDRFQRFRALHCPRFELFNPRQTATPTCPVPQPFGTPVRGQASLHHSQ